MTARRMTIPFPASPKYGDAEIGAVTRLMRAGRLSEVDRGPAITALEDDFAAAIGTARALSFSSGTAALHAALHAAGANPGQGVIMSPMTWISAITAAFHAGSFPIFADLAPDSPNLDPAAIDPADCSAILVTHAWGIPAPVDKLTSMRTPVIEDCSHAPGAACQGRPVGSWGMTGCFSLQESKMVSGGEGGILTTSDEHAYQRALTVGHHPARLAAELTDPGLLPLAGTGASYKYRMPAIAAVIAREQLRTLPARMKNCEANLANLADLITDATLPLAPVPLEPGTVRGWYGTPFTVLEPVTDPAALLTTLKVAGLPARALYPDWLAAPLLRDPALAARYWPHARASRPAPDPRDFPRYQRFRRQTIILKIPEVPAPAYITQLAEVLATAIRATLATASKETR